MSKQTKADLLIEIADLQFQLDSASHREAELENTLSLENEDRLEVVRAGMVIARKLADVKQELQHMTMQRDAKDDRISELERGLKGLANKYDDLHEAWLEVLNANADLHDRLTEVKSPFAFRIGEKLAELVRG